MKKTLLLKQIALAILLIVPFMGNAQRLLTENFEYNDGNFTDQLGGWTLTGNENFPLVITSTPQLEYENYQKPGIGKSVFLDTWSGQDIVKPFTTQSAGDIYASVLVNVSETSNDNTSNSDYFFHFGDSELSTYGGRVFVKKNSTGDKLVFGISKASTGATAQWTSEEYDFNQTHLIVVKYSIVAGEKNDEVSLFVNPSISSPTAAANSTDTGNDLPDIGSIGIRQPTSARSSKIHMGALRVSTTWEGLFDDGGITPDPTPTITATTGTSSHIGELPAGTVYPISFTVKGKNLKGDISVAIKGDAQGEMTCETTTIAKADAEKEEGVNVVFTLRPTSPDIFSETITFSSEGCQPAESTFYWSTTPPPHDVADLASFRTRYAELEAELGEYVSEEKFKFTGEAIVSHAYLDKSGKTNIFIQDATGGLKIIESFKGDFQSTYTAGDKISNFVFTAAVSWGSMTAQSVSNFGAPVSQSNEVTPATLTLAELKAQGARYEGCLIKVENLTITPSKEGNFGDEGTTPIYLKQTDGDNTTLFVLPNADFIGTVIPETAKSIIGISTSATGTAIAPRSISDIETGGTVSIDQTSKKEISILVKDGMIQVLGNQVQNIEVYTMTGVKTTSASHTDRISLPAGVYLVKATPLNGTPTIQKVLVR